MRLTTIWDGTTQKACAVLSNGMMLDLRAAAEIDGLVSDALAAGAVQTIVEADRATHDHIRALIDKAETGSFTHACYAAADVTLLAPIPQPRKNVFCVGRNYAEHIAEGNRAQNITDGVSSHPVFFTKPLTAVIGSGAAVPIFPHVSTNIDYEIELAIVIGKTGRDITRENALDHIFGYTILNDITARDVQRRHGGQYFKGKSLDGSCPMGPWIVTADDVPDPHALRLVLTVNGEERQNGNTASMIFDIPALIASLSEGLTLEPGDIIATGTPSGVGYAMTPPQYLKDGDLVVCEIEKLGRLVNPIRVM
jgi:2-keto-4-pentenoate hydratase/2-oxohepta-3-ene-1,7-dioic acid hydratase in catechol pathway